MLHIMFVGILATLGIGWGSAAGHAFSYNH
jgi:hypothetical protein